ncbi:MAG: rhodanese-like domain-containing protein [Mariniphaga sp.]
MDRLFKTNLIWFSLPALAVVIILLAYVFRPNTLDYKMNVGDCLKLVNDPSVFVDIKDLAGKQVIDLRTEEVFLKGHPEGAINLPIRQLLDEESLETLDELLESGKTAVLVGNNELQATSPLFLLRQMGYTNTKLLKGGFSTTNELVATDLAATEVSVIDTSAIHVKPALSNQTVTNSPSVKTESIKPVKKAVSAGGGC